MKSKLKSKSDSNSEGASVSHMSVGRGAYVRCSVAGCRRKAIEGGCCVHHEAALNPMDHVHRITELEAMTFRALDAEARNLTLSVKAQKLEIQAADGEMEKIIAGHKRRQEIRAQQIEQTQSQIDVVKAEYLKMVTALAEKRDMDPKFMSVDPEARIIRDLRGDVATSPSSDPKSDLSFL